MAPSKKSSTSSSSSTPGSATVKVNTSSINAKDALTTAPAPKPWALILSIWGALVAIFVVDTSRQFVREFALQSWLHASGSLIVLVTTLLYSFSLLRTEEWRGGGVAGIFNHADYSGMEKKVDQSIDSFLDNFSEASRAGDGSHDQKLAQRKANYMNMVNHFYDLVTDFYEYGWGDCFHFGFRFAGEGFHESIRRTEYYLAARIGLNASTHAVDVGCGVGGPMRNIARFTGSKITGINNNGYQIKVGTKHNIRWGLDKQCSFLQSDFMKINVPDATFDHAYAIEATCHAPDKVGCYKEVFRLIKPGGYFGAYEWCVTPQYDAKNPRHVAIREGIEIGNSLPVLATFDEVTSALRKAGFEVVDSFNAQRDAHAGPQHVPWYQSLAGEYSLAGFRMTPAGRAVTHAFVSTLEFMRIAPKGSTKVSKLLNDTAIDLVDGGRLEIFTPSFFVLARKPLNA